MIVFVPVPMVKLLEVKLPTNLSSTWSVPFVSVRVPRAPAEFSWNVNKDHAPCRSTVSVAAKPTMCEPQ